MRETFGFQLPLTSMVDMQVSITWFFTPVVSSLGIFRQEADAAGERLSLYRPLYSNGGLAFSASRVAPANTNFP
jgi:hypothetical protein